MRNSALVLLVFLIAACEGGSSSVRNTLGLNRAAPDEFKVVSRPPLSVPPGFGLRPPEPGAPPRGVAPAEEQAASMVKGRPLRPATHSDGLDGYARADVETAVDPVLSGSLESAADARFLNRAGADQADDDIRSRLYREKDDPAMKPSGRFAIENWLAGAGEEDVIDPKAEAERIRENIDADRPVNEGEVKTQQRDPVSAIDVLF